MIKKIENLALWVKNLQAEAVAYKAEKDSFAQKQKTAENKAESIKEFLSSYLAGVTYKSTRVNVSFRKSKAVEVYDLNELMKADDSDNFLKYSLPTPDKTAIKAALQGGLKVPGCQIIENQNIQIK